MKRIKYLALAALVGVWACSSDTTTPEITGSIAGKVTIEGTGASGITVTLSSGASTTTGSDGSYSFSGVAGGAYTVTISDYPSDVTFSSTSKAAAIQTAGQSVPVDFSGSYIRTASIVGAVTAGGTGIAGVSVAAAGPGGTQNKVTDANGNFTFSGLRAGSYTVTISDIPSGYTFTTSSKTVTVAVGATENAQFAGTKDQDEVTASVVIQSVKLPNGNSANPAAIAGQIDITLGIEPGTNQLAGVCVLLDGVEVPNGCQTLGSGVAGQAAAPEAAATFEPTFTILTNSYDATTGTPAWLNQNHTLSAVVDLTNATQSSVETSMQLTFANTDMVVATVEPEFSAVGSLAPNSGKLFYGGDQTVKLLPVLYSGKSLASASVQFTGNATSKTATTFPGSVKFTNDPASGSTPAGPLFNYQSAVPDVDQFKISAALYSDGTSATALVGTAATGPNGNTHTIDEKPPTAVPLNLTDQIDGALDGTACCANNWVGPDYAFDDGLTASSSDQAGGVGISTTQYFVGAASAKQADVIAGTPVETAGDAGLALSFTNDEYTVYAVFVDKVSNKTVVKLSSNGSHNTLTTFGFDNTMPTAFKVAAGSEPDKIIYNIANTGPGLNMSFSQTEDRSGFSSVPLSAYIVRYDPEDDPSPYYAVAQDTEDGGAINVASTLNACAAATDPTAAAPCYPNNNTLTQGLWMLDAAGQDQAGNRTETHVQRWVLIDAEAPLTQNVALPPQLVANSSVTYSAPVTDTHELWSVAFGQDFGNDGIYIPFGENVMVGDGNRWDTNFTTSATATLTLPKAVVAREYAPGGAPAGAFTYTTNVQAVTTDAAGNQSAPIGNNFIPGTVDPTGKAAIFATTTNWTVSEPSAAVTLCNGQGGTACDVDPGPDVESVDLEIIAQGATGTYANPFGASGVIYVYVFTGGQYYLIGSVNAASAALTDDGATRTYTWTFTVNMDDVAFIGDGTNIGLVAIGLNAATGTVLQSDANNFVTVVNGS